MYWNWKVAGIALGLCFFVTILVKGPIGVSTQFVVVDGVAANLISPGLVSPNASAKAGYESTNPYLNKSGGKIAKEVAEPLNYGFLFVVSMFFGGLLARFMSGAEGSSGQPVSQVPLFHERRFGNSFRSRAIMSFVGGVIVLWGARLAGGCTSGHMMSGMMQSALSGYAFAAAAFLVAVPVALVVYKK